MERISSTVRATRWPIHVMRLPAVDMKVARKKTNWWALSASARRLCAVGSTAIGD